MTNQTTDASREAFERIAHSKLNLEWFKGNSICRPCYLEDETQTAFQWFKIGISTRQPMPLSEEEAVEIILKVPKATTEVFCLRSIYRALLAATSIKPATVSEDAPVSNDGHCTVKGSQTSLVEGRESSTQMLADIMKAKEALETAKRFYARKSRPPTPAYLLEAIAALEKYGEKQ